MEIIASKMRTSIAYEGARETLVIGHYMNAHDLVHKALSLFKILYENWEDYALFIEEINSRVRCSDQLRDGDKLRLTKKVQINLSTSIELKNFAFLEKEHLSPFERNTGRFGEDQHSDEVDERLSNKEDKKDDELPIKTNIEPLKTKSYYDRTALKEELDIWSVKERIGLIFKSQEREHVNGIKISILYCDKKFKKRCPFSLEFRTETKTGLYKLYKENNVHNHSLNKYDSGKALNDAVKEKIKAFMNHTKSYRELADLVNKECNTNFFWRTIYYQAKKFEEELQGKPSEDAQNLIKMLETDSNQRGGFYDVELKNNQLVNCCFMTKSMKTNLKYFSDVLIIDTTYKVNRFNMPLLDIVAINNHGKTVTCFIALLSNQKHETFLWALQKFKTQIDKNPPVIFSDEEEGLTQGKFFKINF